MEQKMRDEYTPPEVEVIPLETESVIALSSGSAQLPDMPINPLSTTRRRSSYGAAPAGELEDLINDILTVEQ